MSRGRKKNLQTVCLKLRFILFWGLVFLLGAIINADLLSSRAVAEGKHEEIMIEEARQESYYRMVDEDGRTLIITGRRLRVGDRFLAEDNRLFEVFSVKNHLARARLVDKKEIGQQMVHAAALTGIRRGGDIAAQGRPSYKIAIYHTHNAESYVPSDGTDSIYGRGGIHDVGVAFKQALDAKGINVLHSERLHLPHDRGAYRRSRSTVQELAAQRPDAIFDVHRDAAPWDAYAREVDGEWISQVMIVVGRSNPGAALNQTFAYDLKGYADRLHPGLVKGVLFAWGGYNQDLYPLNLLLEVGAHTNTKESAKKGITLFADVVAYYFYGPEILERDTADPRDTAEDGPLPPALYRDAGGIYGAISGTVISLLLASLAAAVGFYFLNNPGSLEELYRWWDHFPEKVGIYIRYTGEALKNTPSYLRHRSRMFPSELREAWIELRREARIFPEWLYARVSAAGRHLSVKAKAAAGAAVKVPESLARAYRDVAADTSRLAGELGEWVHYLRDRLLAMRNRLR